MRLTGKAFKLYKGYSFFKCVGADFYLDFYLGLHKAFCSCSQNAHAHKCRFSALLKSNVIPHSAHKIQCIALLIRMLQTLISLCFDIQTQPQIYKYSTASLQWPLSSMTSSKKCPFVSHHEFYCYLTSIIWLPVLHNQWLSFYVLKKIWTPKKISLTVTVNVNLTKAYINVWLRASVL